jgi:hypothetical protein
MQIKKSRTVVYETSKILNKYADIQRIKKFPQINYVKTSAKFIA